MRSKLFAVTRKKLSEGKFPSESKATTSSDYPAVSDPRTSDLSFLIASPSQYLIESKTVLAAVWYIVTSDQKQRLRMEWIEWLLSSEFRKFLLDHDLFFPLLFLGRLIG